MVGVFFNIVSSIYKCGSGAGIMPRTHITHDRKISTGHATRARVLSNVVPQIRQNLRKNLSGAGILPNLSQYLISYIESLANIT